MLSIPTHCPICKSSLIRVNDQIFCKNDNCDAKTSKKLLHFIKTMKIKGLGEKTVEKLELYAIPELYSVSLSTMVLRLGEKVGTKLFNEIKNSKIIPTSTYIQAFGITLIGNAVSTKLAKHINSIWDINTEVCKVAGLGEKATSYLLKWITENEMKYKDLPIKTVSILNKENEVEELYKVVITGKLNDYSSRVKAKDFLEAKGITVLSGVSSKINYLVCDNISSSSSCSKAEKLNIPIISMNDLLNILN